MKVFTTLIDTNNIEENLESFISEKNIKENCNKSSSSLCIIYVPFTDKEKVKKVMETIKKFLPNISIIGCSASSVIYNGKANDNLILVSFLFFEKNFAKVIYFKESDFYQDGIKLGSYIKNFYPNAKAILVFLDSPFSNGETFLKGIDSVNKKVIVIGALASKDKDKKESLIFINNEIFSKGCVATIFYGEDLNVDTFYCLGWRAVGKNYQVTQASENKILEIESIKATEFYKSHLKEDSLNVWSSFPLILVDRKFRILRTPIKINGTAIKFGGNIKEKENVKFAIGLPEQIIEDCKNKLSSISSFYPELAIIFSSIFRKAILGKYINEELSYFSPYKHIGFFTEGEIFTDKKTFEKIFLNNSLTFLLLSESSKKPFFPFPKKREKEEKRNVKVARAFIDLVDFLSQDLEGENKQLEMLSTYDFLTNLYNKRTIIKFLEKEIEFSKKNKVTFSILMLDIDHFKKINDTYGHLMGDKVLKKLANILKQNVREKDLVGRYGGEEFLIVLPNTSKSRAKDIAERIRKSVEKTLFPENIRITISIGVTEYLFKDNISTLIERADQALYKAKKEGRNRVVIL